MYSIRQCFCLNSFLHLAYAFCHRTVGKEHELLYELIGIPRHLEIALDRLSSVIDVEMQFLTLEFHRPILEAFKIKMYWQK